MNLQSHIRLATTPATWNEAIRSTISNLDDALYRLRQSQELEAVDPAYAKYLLESGIALLGDIRGQISEGLKLQAEDDLAIDRGREGPPTR